LFYIPLSSYKTADEKHLKAMTELTFTFHLVHIKRILPKT